MLSELYLYAFPKVLKDKPSQFKIWHVSILMLFPFMLWVENMVFSLSIMLSVLVLYLLCFAIKDLILRHLNIVVLFALDFAIVLIYMMDMIFPNYRLVPNSIIGGIIISIIYEIVVFIRIKNKFYSNPTDMDKKIYSIAAVILIIFYISKNLFLKNSEDQSVIAIGITVICSFAALCVVISIQKLVVYLLTRNKIQMDCNNGKEIE